MKKPKVYLFDKVLHNAVVSYKIDGVQAQYFEGDWLSRAGKPLHNLPSGIEEGVYEVYLGTWSESVSAVRTHEGNKVDLVHLYRLDILDHRLGFHCCAEITPTEVSQLLKEATDSGYEGLCIQSDEGSYKVKPVETYDVIVTGMIEGVGKYDGKLGALITDLGNVGTGFTDSIRESMWENPPIGSVIEVRCMSLTPGGKFRHPRYIRTRLDKSVGSSKRECLDIDKVNRVIDK